jgi:hypothetical protein
VIGQTPSARTAAKPGLVVTLVVKRG